MRTFQSVQYNNKSYEIPQIDPSEGMLRIEPQAVHDLHVPADSLLLRDLNKPFDIGRFMEPRLPLSLGKLSGEDRQKFSAPSHARNVLDLPIKFPGSEVRLPHEYAQWSPVVQRTVDAMRKLNTACYDEYYLYLTLRRGRVKKGGQGHFAPVHVDGFQGARWTPKHRANHTVTVTDRFKTLYFPQAFDLSQLDVATHDVFWEMNRQVALTNGSHAWDAYEEHELMLMDAYCAHIARDAEEEGDRTWLRLSFETRIFDRLGNGHNPFFAYDWEMVPRDIEQLGLKAFDETSDPSLRVFPWQAVDGSVNPSGVATKPDLKPRG